MFGSVDNLTLGFGVVAPEKKYKILFLVGEEFDDGIGELFPPFFLMRTSKTGTNGESGIEQENSLSSPAIQIAGLSYGFAKV